jgi:penicillin amidase
MTRVAFRLFGVVSLAIAIAPLPLLHAQNAALRELAKKSLARIDGELPMAGLERDVQVIRDRWGIPHIYAQSVDDLFAAQGYVMAQDRLWQMEIWRRTAAGRLAEILGPAAVGRDTQARLLKYRGPMDEVEWTSYHPEAKRIFTAYVKGVNAFISQHASNLPVEFQITGLRPEPWTIEDIVLRAITFGDASNELRLARSVVELGAKEANRRANPDPFDELRAPDGLDLSVITEQAAASVRGGGGPGNQLPRPEILPTYRGAAVQRDLWWPADDIKEPGSNNWVVSGAMSVTGKPVVANDPHREVSLPSLRYIVHLNAPGWNVIGSGEPPFVGVAIGHNERLAWGLTIVGTDQHDVFVEELNPANANEVRYNGRWEPLRVVREEIRVKGQSAQTVELKFSRHGPIFHVDTVRQRAYALKSALHEPGTAPYLGGLRLAQARTCREFQGEAMYWKAPSENLICGDVDGNISWQASALTPARKGWVGRLPVPGTGQYEWTGYRKDLPRELNPARGFIATANHNIQPKGYEPPLMFKDADTRFQRITRLMQVLTPGKKLSLEDHQRLQHDAFSLQAAADRPLFQGWTSTNANVERARAAIAAWDHIYARDSAAGAIYQTWRTVADRRALDEATPPGTRQPLIEAGLQKAVDRLTSEQGPDARLWRWGRMHTRAFRHPVSDAFNLPTVERAGGAGTVAADGATYREIMDVSDWDRSLVVNVPGQSGQPESPFYGNLLQTWADNQYFALAYSRKAVEEKAAHRLTLKPVARTSAR